MAQRRQKPRKVLLRLGGGSNSRLYPLTWQVPDLDLAPVINPRRARSAAFGRRKF